MSDTYIELQNISYRYPRTKKYVLKNINMKINKGEFIAIVGENGAGKTTLCKCFNGIIPNSEKGKLKGNVIIDGLDTKTAAISEISQKVGIVLEDPGTQLFTTKVLTEVAFGPENLRKLVDDILGRIKWALKVVRLEGYEEHPPTALSGGQKQRLAIAAALAMRPDIIVLDEPTSQLDPLGTQEVFEVVKELKEKYNMTIIMVSHKIEEVVEFADKVCVLENGEVLAYDSPDVIFADRELFNKVRIIMPSAFAVSNYLKDKGNIDVGCFVKRKEGVDKFKKLLKEVIN